MTKKEKDLWYKAMTGKEPETGKGLYWQMKNNPPKPLDLSKENLLKALKELFNK